MGVHPGMETKSGQMGCPGWGTLSVHIWGSQISHPRYRSGVWPPRRPSSGSVLGTADPRGLCRGPKCGTPLLPPFLEPS